MRAYYSPYDAVLLCQLYGPMGRLPAEISAFVRDLMEESDRVEASVPEQASPVHHALHDLLIAKATGLITKKGTKWQIPRWRPAAPTRWGGSAMP